MAKKYLAFPVQLKNGNLMVAMTEPTNNFAVDELKSTVKVPVQAGVSTEKEIIDAYKKYYHISDEEYKAYLDDSGSEEEVSVTTVDDLGELIADVQEEFEVIEEEDDDDTGQLSANEAPIIKLVNQILYKAIQTGVFGYPYRTLRPSVLRAIQGGRGPFSNP